MNEFHEYPLTLDWDYDHPDKSPRAVAIDTPTHGAVAEVLIRMEGHREDSPHLLELAERLVGCYNLLPPGDVATKEILSGDIDYPKLLASRANAEREYAIKLSALKLAHYNHMVSLKDRHEKDMAEAKALRTLLVRALCVASIVAATLAVTCVTMWVKMN